MVYHGQVKNGVIVLEGDARLPEGTEVRVDVKTNGDPPIVTEPIGGTVWDDLLELAGTAHGLPSDFARQHDHYLYGTPKR